MIAPISAQLNQVLRTANEVLSVSLPDVGKQCVRIINLLDAGHLLDLGIRQRQQRNVTPLAGPFLLRRLPCSPRHRYFSEFLSRRLLLRLIRYWQDLSKQLLVYWSWSRGYDYPNASELTCNRLV